MMQEFIAAHWLDMLTTLLGLAYIVLEYHASIWLWVVGFAMQSLGIVLYYQKGLYADCGMEFYYLAMTVYGFFMWIRKSKSGSTSAPSQLPITHFPDSRVPLTDAFTTALSFVGIWALARKYLEQWLIWIVVDIVTCILYFYKDIPFKASLYALYVVIAIAGYLKWKKMMVKQTE